MLDIISEENKAILLEDLQHIKTFANSDKIYHLKSDQIEVNFDMKYHTLKTGDKKYVCAGRIDVFNELDHINITLFDKKISYQRMKDKEIILKCFITFSYAENNVVYKIYPQQKQGYTNESNYISTTNKEMNFIQTLIDKSRKIAFFNTLAGNISSTKEYEELKKHINYGNINTLQILFKKVMPMKQRYDLLQYITILLNEGFDPFNLSIEDKEMIMLQADLKIIDFEKIIKG